jgi:hypothetical protein
MPKLLPVLLVAISASGCSGMFLTPNEAVAEAPNLAAAQKICERHGKQAQHAALAEDYGAHFRAYFGFICVEPGDPRYVKP